MPENEVQPTIEQLQNEYTRAIKARRGAAIAQNATEQAYQEARRAFEKAEQAVVAANTALHKYIEAA